MKRILLVCLLAGAALGCNSNGRASDGQKPASTAAPADGAEPAVKPEKPSKADGEIRSCSDLGARACARLEECAPFLLQAYYGERATCEELFTGICEQAANGERPVDLGSCSQALDVCESFVAARGVPPACFKPVGVGKLGDACRSDLDCGAGLCELGKDDKIGHCATPAALGEACPPPTRCAAGLRCSPADVVCFKSVANGKPCANSLDCELGSKCGADLVCAPTELGDTCDQAGLPCNAGLGQTCLLGQCAALKFADDQVSCLTGNVECPGTQRCLVKQLANLERSASCADTARLGEACNADTPCIEPLSCRSGTCSP